MKLVFPRTPKPDSIAPESWNDWKWQYKNSLKTRRDFDQFFKLTSEETEAFEKTHSQFKSQSTPYYASLANSENPADPIRKIIIPQINELAAPIQAEKDPLGEINHSPSPRIIHRYPDRALFLVTDMCGVYCRYCTRKHFTGQDRAFPRTEEYQAALQYLKSNKSIREVILSGGDPLTLSDDRLLKVFEDLSTIPHIELIRIGSRMPVANPMRITDNLVSMLKVFHPVYMMVHFNHPRELTEESAEALTRLVDNGFPVMNQMVLLNGINNHEAIVQALSRRLLRLRVKPYYMFQVDPSEGTDHLRTSIKDSQKIQSELWGRVSGLMLPNLSLDIPGGGGKTGFTPDFIVREKSSSTLFKGWDGIQAEYINPPEAKIRKPSDIEDYLEEWNQIKNAKYGANKEKPKNLHHHQPEANLF